MALLSKDKTVAVTAIVKSAESKALVEKTLADRSSFGCTVRAVPLHAAKQRLIDDATSGILLVEVDLEDDGDLNVLEQIAEALRGTAALIALTRSSSITGMRRLVHIGVADIVPMPPKKEDLVSAIESASNRLERPPPSQPVARKRGRVVSVLKAGGGSGATTLAVHMAEALRRRKPQRSTVLVDLDLQFGSDALHLDLNGDATVLEALDAGERLDATLLEGVVSRRQSGLHVLPAPEVITPLDAVTPEHAERLIEVCAQTYEATIVELPYAWTAWTRAVLAASDAVVLVTQLTVQGIHHAGRQITTIQDEGLHMLPVIVVVNRHNRSLFGDSMIRDAEKALNHRLDHFIPSDYKALSKAADCGMTLYDMRTARKVTKRIEAVAEAALSAALPAAAPTT